MGDQKQQQIQLASRPKGMPTKEVFHFTTVDIPVPNDGEVLIQTKYVSVDPYMRGRMQDTKSYTAPFKLNEVIKGGVVGEVIESKSDQLQTGDFVLGFLGWQEYSTASADSLTKIDPSIAPLSYYLGLLGMPGQTAYFGLLSIGQPKEGETVVVSGAAGAVGSVVGQIAKIKGAHVVGIAGSDDKLAYLKELGFDETINYKTTPDMNEAIEKACPNGVDVYFDNVGGEISDAVMNHLNQFARIPVCGAISAYNVSNANEDIGPRVQTKLIKTSALMQGFVVGNYADRFGEAAKDLAHWVKEDKLVYKETIVEGFEKIPDAFLGLFKGENIGKQLVKI
ncbi:NADP-dependent oxidoreductase [Bacillus sp. NPDC077027]|uniref:NADP-dependent oxidoreductase n=1 Tax=Bacillus sp. NPDC077027 TaxID=3390548 RepID=UPI003D05DE8A